MEVKLQVQRVAIRNRVASITRRELVDVDANGATILYRKHQLGANVYVTQEEPKVRTSQKPLMWAGHDLRIEQMREREKFRVRAQIAQTPGRCGVMKRPFPLQYHPGQVFVFQWRRREKLGVKYTIPVKVHTAFLNRHEKITVVTTWRLMHRVIGDEKTIIAVSACEERFSHH